MINSRPAKDSDGPRIRELWRSNPVGGSGPYYLEGWPDKSGYRLFVVESEGNTVGTFSLCPDHLAERAALYLSDVVLERSERGRGFMHRACAATLEKVLTPEIQFLTALYPAGNRQSEKAFESTLLRVRYRTPFEFIYLPSLRARDPELTSDYEQVCDLVNAFYAGHSFFRPLRPESLLTRRNFEVLAEREQGRIVATVGVWRQQYARRLRVVDPGCGTRLALGLLGRFNARVEAVDQGPCKELVAHALTEPAFAPGHERAFERLLSTIGWRRDAHAHRAVFHSDSPIAPLFGSRFRFRFQTNLVVFQTGTQSAELPERRGPVFHDFSWL